jgi:dimethylargininase
MDVASKLALTREVSPAILRCELTHLQRTPIDLERARAQHDAYEEALRAAGCEVQRLPPAPDLPDAVFVEDTAIVLDELAVIARPGASSRRSETESVAAALTPHRALGSIDAPGTLDGGDVLRVGRKIFVGRSSRSNSAGIAQLTRLCAPHGYQVRAVEVTGCLHLKSAVTGVSEKALLINRRWIDAAAFGGYELIDVDPDEPGAANVLRIGGTLIYPAAYPRTARRLERHGRLAMVELSELAKCEGAVTCCSLILAASR